MKEFTRGYDGHDSESWDDNIDRLMDDEDEDDNAIKGALIGSLLGLAIWAVVLGVLCWYWNRG